MTTDPTRPRSPLVKIDGIYAKLECTHACGSIKDRIVEYILQRNEAAGVLKPGAHIVEATSGNTGIAWAYYGRRHGYAVTIVMPENMTEERKRAMRDLGAELILCSKEGSFAEAAAIRDRLAKEHGWFNPDQFSNPLNVECHFETTGREILDQMREQTAAPIDAFVAGIGTGGTLVGIGKRLRAVHPKVHIVAVEPQESAVMSGGPAGLHGIGGIGDGFVPALAQGTRNGLHELIDEVACISTEDARQEALRNADVHGYCVGVSSGANLAVSRRLLARYATVVTILPDGFVKYQSMGLKAVAPGACPFQHEPVVGSCTAQPDCGRRE